MRMCAYSLEVKDRPLPRAFGQPFVLRRLMESGGPLAAALVAVLAGAVGPASFAAGFFATSPAAPVVPHGIGDELQCVCQCAPPSCPLPTILLYIGIGACVVAWVLGFVYGSCCPRAAVRHKVEIPRAVRGAQKGVWGAPALTHF